jgi:hypothetical protein
MVVRGDDQELRIGAEVRPVLWRTSAASRWATDGRMQNLNRVEMDCGSEMRWVRRLVAEVKSKPADWRKSVQEACEPIGGPRR